ncbi:hypothetical protein AB6C40_17720, partial [Vibrio splendidus]
TNYRFCFQFPLICEEPFFCLLLFQTAFACHFLCCSEWLFFKRQNINLRLITDPVEKYTTLVGLN